MSGDVVRWLIAIGWFGCADRTVSEQPPVQCGEQYAVPLDEHGRGCLEPGEPGSRFACDVSIVDPALTRGVIVPPCEATAHDGPCWYIANSAAECTSEHRLAINVPPGPASPPDDLVLAYCRACPP